jgi:hypothetical protein
MVQPASSSSVSPSFVACEVYSGADFTSFVGGTTMDVGLVTPEMSGSNVAQIPTGGAWLYCWVSSGPASYYQPATVSFVKLNSNRTGTPMAVAAKNAPRPESMVR